MRAHGGLLGLGRLPATLQVKQRGIDRDFDLTVTQPDRMVVAAQVAIPSSDYTLEAPRPYKIPHGPALCDDPVASQLFNYMLAQFRPLDFS
eukprot:2629609-Pyramimonas_sp.AAC.1